MPKASSGTSSILIDRPPSEVWAAITDVTRVGEWSPECRAGRWLGGETAAAVGVQFEGDNEYRLAGRVVSKWSTKAVITKCDPHSIFEFVSSAYTTWTYELEAAGSATKITESFSYVPRGTIHLLEDRLFRRRVLQGGVEKTLHRMKGVLEGR
jgi:uncharacterized protein YndB with AHSA1/START domain